MLTINLHPAGCQSGGLGSVVTNSLLLDRLFAVLTLGRHRDPAGVAADYGHHAIDLVVIEGFVISYTVIHISLLGFSIIRK